MNLDLNTFGKTPACLYLAHLLNERGNPLLARKVGKFLGSVRTTLNDVVACHYTTDEMKRTTFHSLIEMIEADARNRALLFEDKFIGHLCVNILIGEIRTYKRRAAKASVLQDKVARITPEGETVPDVKAFPSIDEESEEERIERLRDKSNNYLARKNKISTLY